jgi:hypothetical protein
VFDPVGCFEVRRAELAWVSGIEALGNKAFKNLGVPKFVKVL